MFSVKRLVLALAAILAASGSLHARSTTDVTIVYNVQTREFTCWYEGQPRPQSPCLDPSGATAHPYFAGIHFFRGQTVFLQYDGAHVADFFAPVITVAGLTEPSVPIFGALSELPSIKGLAPQDRIVLPAGQKFVRSQASKLLNLLSLLDVLKPAEFFSSTTALPEKHQSPYCCG